MKSGKDVNIIIADTQYLTSTALKTILNESFHIAGVAGSKSELYRYLTITPDALIILDYMLFDLEGYADIRKLKENFPESGILILTNAVSHADFNELNASGIKNILLKTADLNEIFQGIEAALKDKKYYSETILDLLIDSNGKKDLSSGAGHLTASEIEIVKLIAEGFTTKEIASRKFISFHTVMSHRKNIFRKLGVKSISELIMFAIKAGWIDNIEYYI